MLFKTYGKTFEKLTWKIIENEYWKLLWKALGSLEKTSGGNKN